MVAQQLEILEMVRPALGLRNDVIHGEILKREVMAAAVAATLLLSVQSVLAGLVGRALAHLRPLWGIRAVNDMLGVRHPLHLLSLSVLPQSVYHQLGGLGADIDPGPHPAQCVRRNTCRRAAAEWVQQYVSRVARRLDDSIQECQRLLRRAPDMFLRPALHVTYFAPNRLDWHSAPFAKQVLPARDSARSCLHDQSLIDELPHPLFRVAPEAGDTHDLVLRIALR